MITLQEVQTLINEETKKLKAIGIIPEPVLNIEFVKARSFYADAWRRRNKIRVSEYFRNAPIQEIRATIMHELLHMVESAGHGHGAAWRALADRVNKAYPQYAIKRCGSQLVGGTDWNLRRTTKAPRAPHIHMVICTECGHEWKRTRESRLTLHPEFYSCICGGKLKRLY